MDGLPAIVAVDLGHIAIFVKIYLLFGDGYIVPTGHQPQEQQREKTDHDHLQPATIAECEAYHDTFLNVSPKPL
jgi:hypothetical protein